MGNSNSRGRGLGNANTRASGPTIPPSTSPVEIITGATPLSSLDFGIRVICTKCKKILIPPPSVLFSCPCGEILRMVPPSNTTPSPALPFTPLGPAQFLILFNSLPPPNHALFHSALYSFALLARLPISASGRVDESSLRLFEGNLIRERQEGVNALVRILPTFPFTPSPSLSPEASSCGICLEQFVQGQEIRTLPCLHIFHATCSEKWLNSHAVCPYCHCDISTNPAPPEGEGGEERGRGKKSAAAPQQSH